MPPFTAEPEPMNEEGDPGASAPTEQGELSRRSTRHSEPTIDSIPSSPPSRRGSEPHATSVDDTPRPPPARAASSQLGDINELPVYSEPRESIHIGDADKKAQEDTVTDLPPSPPASPRLQYQPYQSKRRSSTMSSQSQQQQASPPSMTPITMPVPLSPPLSSPASYPLPASPPPPMSPPPITSQQPVPTRSMSTNAFDPRNAKNVNTDSRGARNWSYNIFACTDVGVCAMAWICPCIVYGQIQSRLQHLTRFNAPHPSGGVSCGSDCITHGCLTCCCAVGWVLQISQRGNVRSRYSIHGDGCTDCLCAWCCTPCELAQSSNELALEERSLLQMARPPPPQPPMQVIQQNEKA